MFLTACTSNKALNQKENTGSFGNQKKSANDGKTINLVLWHYYLGESQKQIDAAVKEFNETVGLEEGIFVNAEAKGRVFELEKLLTHAALGLIDSETMPDIFSSYLDKAIELNELYPLCDISKYVSEEEKSAYVKEFLYDGFIKDESSELISIPIAKSTEVLYMNETGYEEFLRGSGSKPLELNTWDNIYETAKSYYEYTDGLSEGIKNDGKAFMGLETPSNYIIAASKQLSKPIFDEEREAARLNIKALKPVFENYYKGMALGYYGAFSEFRTDDLKTGAVLAFTGSSSGAAYFPSWIEIDDKRLPIKGQIMPYPSIDGEHFNVVRQGAGMCISSSTEDKERAAATFLKWFTNKENNVKFVENSGYLPVVKAAYENDYFVSYMKDNAVKSKADINVLTDVYDIAKHQILDGNTYSAKPFKGSYDIRNIVADKMQQVVEAGKNKAIALREQGKSEEELLEAIDVDGSFEAWLSGIQDELANANIAYYVE